MDKKIYGSDRTDRIWYYDYMDEDSDISLICVVDCPDCDTTVVTDPEYVSVFLGFGEIWAITMCSYCERPVSCNIDKELALELAELEVKVFSWETGTEMDIAGVQNL